MNDVVVTIVIVIREIIIYSYFPHNLQGNISVISELQVLILLLNELTVRHLSTEPPCILLWPLSAALELNLYKKMYTNLFFFFFFQMWAYVLISAATKIYRLFLCSFDNLTYCYPIFIYFCFFLTWSY